MEEAFKNELMDAGVDYNTTLERFMGKEDLYEKFLFKFIDDRNFIQFEENILNKDVQAAYKSAHILKGLSGNLGFDKMFEIIVPIVEELRAGSLDNAEKSLADLKEIYNLLCGIIIKYRSDGCKMPL